MIYFDGIVFSLQKFGGISTYFRELIRGIELDKESKTLLYSEENINNFKNPIFLKRRILERYRNVTLPENAKIFHSSYYRITANKKIKNIITVYDFTYEKFEKFPSKTIHSTQKKNAIKKADSIICISENTRQDLFEFYPQIDKNIVSVVHLAASVEFQKLFIPFNQKINIEPFVLFVGARAGYKNFVTAVEALRDLRTLRLVFVGGGELLDYELSLLNKIIPDRYKHIPSINTQELNVLYNTAICLLYPSLYEGFGIPILEAMATGCPVIAANISSIPEVGKDAAILLKDISHEQITAAICKLLNEEENRYYSELGYLNSLKFSWERTVTETKNIYSSFV